MTTRQLEQLRENIIQSLEYLQQQTVQLQSFLNADMAASSAATPAGLDRIYTTRQALENTEAEGRRLMLRLEAVDKAMLASTEPERKRKRQSEEQREKDEADRKRIREDIQSGFSVEESEDLKRKRDLAFFLVSRTNDVFQERMLGVSKDAKKSLERGIRLQPLSPFALEKFLKSYPSEDVVLDRVFRPGSDLSANNNAAIRFCADHDYKQCVSQLLANERLRVIPIEVVQFYVRNIEGEGEANALFSDPRLVLSANEIRDVLWECMNYGGGFFDDDREMMDALRQMYVRLVWKKLKPRESNAIVQEFTRALSSRDIVKLMQILEGVVSEDDVNLMNQRVLQNAIDEARAAQEEAEGMNMNLNEALQNQFFGAP